MQTSECIWRMYGNSELHYVVELDAYSALGEGSTSQMSGGWVRAQNRIGKAVNGFSKTSVCSLTVMPPLASYLHQQTMGKWDKVLHQSHNLLQLRGVSYNLYFERSALSLVSSFIESSSVANISSHNFRITVTI